MCTSATPVRKAFAVAISSGTWDLLPTPAANGFRTHRLAFALYGKGSRRRSMYRGSRRSSTSEVSLGSSAVDGSLG